MSSIPFVSTHVHPSDDPTIIRDGIHLVDIDGFDTSVAERDDVPFDPWDSPYWDVWHYGIGPGPDPCRPTLEDWADYHAHQDAEDANLPPEILYGYE